MSSRNIIGELFEGLQVEHSSDDIEVLPDVLEGVDRKQRICVARLDESLNLNAIAIGLGLENIRYEPERFPGLVYLSSDEDVTAVLFGTGVVIAPTNQAGDPNDFIQQVLERLEEIGLYEGNSDEVPVETMSIDDAISRK